MEEQGLKDKTVKGVAWSGIDNVAQYAVSFIVSIVLARLLSPDDYGLIGIVAIFTSICGNLINGGFSDALVRKKEATDDDYNTVFIVNLGMSLLLYSVIFICAPYIAAFFNREELIALTRVSSVSMIVGALALVQRVRLTKRIDFKTQTKITIISYVISGVVGVTMALLGYGVWALVVSSVSGHVITTTLLWFFNKWIPKIRFSIVSFKELFGFGWKLMVISVINSLWKELYQVVVGKFYNPATLGQYTRAKGFSQLLSTNLTSIVQRVTYPVLSSIQDERERMIMAYRRIIKTTMFVSAIGMFFMGAISEPLIYCLIGSKWHDAAIYLPLICIVGSTYPLQAINLNMLQVQGRSDLFLGIEIVKKIIALGPLFVGAFVGILPMLYTDIIVCVISYFLNSYYTGKLLGYNSLMQLKDIAPSYGIAVLVAMSVWFLKYLPLSSWIILPVQIIVGVIVFLIVCKISRIHEYNEIVEIISPYIKRIKRK